jgi:DNA-binding XRE family transcriptional regulator
MLSPFGIAPAGAIRDAATLTGTAKGYKRETFVDAWNRYLLPESPEEGFQTVTTSQAKVTAASSNFQTVTNEADVTVRKSRKAKETAPCDVVTVQHGASEADKEIYGASASVSLMITQAQKAELRARGFTDEQIRDLRPTEAHAILAEPFDRTVTTSQPAEAAAPNGADQQPDRSRSLMDNLRKNRSVYYEPGEGMRPSPASWWDTEGRRIKTARERRGWSQQQLAKEIGTYQSVISNLEGDKRVDPKIREKVLKELGLDL